MIFEYIAKDKPHSAKIVKEQLDRKFENLKKFPKMYRKSISVDDGNYRYMTLNTIIYKKNFNT